MSKNPVFESLKGFRDFYPEEMAARRQVFGVAREVARSFGYREVNGPSVESLDLFRVKSGDEVVEQTYSFTDKGGRELTLIPELTPTVGRMVAARGKTLPKPIKWYSWGRMWRYEQPQSGRLREFYQLNVDCFGSSTIESDVEILAIAAEIMIKLDLEGEFIFKLNSRKFMENVFENIHIPKNKYNDYYNLIDKYNKIPKELFLNKLIHLVGLTNVNYDILIKMLDKGSYTTLENEVKNTKDLKKYKKEIFGTKDSERIRDIYILLQEYNVEKHFIRDFSIVRGLDYYTDLVFECLDKKGKLRSLFGGGRYDGVVEMFSGQPTPAVGFAMGDAVLEVLMRRTGKWPEPGLETDYYVI